ncbi:hypothetical protein BJI47_04955 [Rhodococcus sp. 1168]|nr:hypothetical protein BJI47_04955 [Rhodococcus sp. 1168]
MTERVRGEECNMIFVGDDWAEDHHDIHVMNTDGKRLATRRLPEGLAGIAAFHDVVAAHAPTPADVVIGIETDRGLWVSALLAGGYTIYAINPLSAQFMGNKTLKQGGPVYRGHATSRRASRRLRGWYRRGRSVHQAGELDVLSLDDAADHDWGSRRT